jgi:general secretion pathway protein G
VAIVPWTFAVAATAATLIVTGATWTGVLLASLVYLGFLRRHATNKTLADVALVGFLVATMLAGSGVARWRSRSAARDQLESLSREIADYAAQSHALPNTLEDLGWRLFPLFDRGRPVDPWGRTWRYRVPGTEGRSFDLGSTGPDGVPSADDIGHPPKNR